MTPLLKIMQVRVVALVAFFGGVLAVLAILYQGTGHDLPLTPSRYTASVTMKDVDNLVAAGSIQEAGVKVGRVDSVKFDGKGAVTVEFSLDEEAAPLHDGAKLRVGSRSLVGETYLELKDGSGAEIADGAKLPDSAVERGVQLHDVLGSLDADTRGNLSELLRTAGATTKGTGDDIEALATALGDLGRGGHVALDALADQQKDLEALSRQTVQVLGALDTSEGQIAELVRNADAITGATAGQSRAIESSMRQLPGVLTTASTATKSLGELADALGPVAVDLRKAGPNLSTALEELPATTRDLHLMLAPLSKVLDRAPATLTRVPTAADDVQDLVPTAMGTLADVNPMLAYLKPYGPDLAAYFANFNAVLNYRDENGAYYLRLTPLVNTHSPQVPVNTSRLLGNYTNAYPGPGTGARPGPFTGDYPRLHRLGD